MKILCVIDSLGSGGAQRQLTLVAGYLKKSGYNVSIACYSKDDFYDTLLEKDEILIYRILSANYFDRIFKFRKFIRNGKFDAVISFLDVPNFLNNFSALGGKKWKVITSERSAQRENFTSRRGKLFNWLQKYSDSIICNSENAKLLWQEYYPKYSKKISTIYNVVNFEEATSQYILKRENKLHIIIVASYQYLKNPIGLINALSLFTNEQKKLIQIDWYGRIEVTEGDTRAYDESCKLINLFNLQNILHLHEETKDILNIMNKADVVALLSSVEGLPNTICEGMSLAKPIIMSRVSDYKVLVDSSNGFLIDWESPASIMEVILKMTTLSSEELLKMGHASKIRADELFNKEIIVNQWIKQINRN